MPIPDKEFMVRFPSKCYLKLVEPQMLIQYETSSTPTNLVSRWRGSIAILAIKIWISVISVSVDTSEEGIHPVFGTQGTPQHQKSKTGVPSRFYKLHTGLEVSQGSGQCWGNLNSPRACLRGVQISKALSRSLTYWQLQYVTFLSHTIGLFWKSRSEK